MNTIPSEVTKCDDISFSCFLKNSQTLALKLSLLCFKNNTTNFVRDFYREMI